MIYTLGNGLRGYFKGEFSSIEDAWKLLSARFLRSYPAQEGRFVEMYVLKDNEYGFCQHIKCKEGNTGLDYVPDEEITNLTRTYL